MILTVAIVATVTIGLEVTIVALMIGVVALIAHVLNAIDSAGDDDDGDDRGDDRGNGGSRRPDAPQPPVGGGEPEWWPEFESDLADYLAARR